MTGLREFTLDGGAYELFVGLVEQRAGRDIERTEAAEQAAAASAAAGAPDADSLLRKAQRFGQGVQARRASAQVVSKRDWLDQWIAEAHQAAGPRVGQRPTLETLQARLPATPEGLATRFLVLQEVLHVPLYAAAKGRPQEVDPRAGATEISQLVGLPGDAGQRILSDTDSFARQATHYWRKVALWTTGATVAALLTAGLAAPGLATAVGTHLLGWHGAAAFTSGLAFFGGGALATGGLGMAGGFTVLVCGGGLLGGATGLGACRALLQVPHEVFVTNTAKLLNYASFLQEHRAQPVLASRRGELLRLFCELKHLVELAALTADYSPTEARDALRQVECLELAFGELARQAATGRS
ncbi:MAG: hypothetical protein IT204_22330 [Fimbriimonadaceae bacterium]|nr:hypothetical protein [Fimbriimonadaceae bacterium]